MQDTILMTLILTMGNNRNEEFSFGWEGGEEREDFEFDFRQVEFEKTMECPIVRSWRCVQSSGGVRTKSIDQGITSIEMIVEDYK